MLVPAKCKLCFYLPLFFSLIAILITIVRGQLAWPVRLAILGISALPVLVLWPYLLKVLFIIVGYALPGLLAFLVVMVLGALLPQWASISKWQKLVLPVVAGVAAAACLGMGIWSSQIDANNPRMDTLFYFADLDQEQAYWVSLDSAPDQFTEQVFGSEFEQSNLGDFIPYEDMPVIYRQTDLDQSGVQDPIKLELISDEIDGEVRRLTLNIQADSEVNNLIIYIEPELLQAAVALEPDFSVEWDERWPVLRYYNVDTDGFTLTIPAVTDQPFIMRILAQTLQLPDVGLLPRPEDTISAPTAITDSTFTFKSYQF